MVSSISSTLKTPWIATIVALVLVWCLWSLELSPRTLSFDSVSQDQAQTKTKTNDPLPTQIASNKPEIPHIESPSEQDTGKHVIDPVSSPAATFSSVTSATVASTSVTSPSAQETGIQKVVSDRPLILYAYSEAAAARENFEFFIAHGLHATADFVFILNGETDVATLIPDKPNIRYVQRPNDCYDLGAHAEVLTTNDLYKKYKRFIMLNASIRGPFVPYWSEKCWSDIYLSRVTKEVKLVGMTSNCWPTFHVQSMIWATDITGIETLLFPPASAVEYLREHPVKLPPKSEEANAKSGAGPQQPGINGCFHDWDSAVAAEVGASSLIKAAGYKIDVLMSAFHGDKEYGSQASCEHNGDVLFNGGYWGTNVHPFETIFIKSNRDVDPVALKDHTDWVNGRGYSSYDYCLA